ncbi:MAG: tripartite tricarboxylate transporter substrate binding protein [Proteobacteria bacterium]|nr:tripartite tricarboxylate transporter substrate binding protein [Pseudomonadota bacterium]
MNKTLFCAAGFAAGLCMAAAGTLAHAQAWPSKPITIVNPFAPGGGVDAFARPLALKYSTALGQQVIVENVAGAGGTVGAANAARRPGDGYTFFMGAVHHAIAESLYAKLPYNIEKDFLPVTVVAYVPNVVVVNARLPFKSMKEFIDYARANPNKLNFGSAGNGTSHHLAVELFKTITGTKLTHVPYKGAGPMMQDLIAGQVDFAFDGMGTAATQIRAGKLRPLAVTTTKRAPLIPDVPTLQEAGIPGYDVTTWYALWAVKGTPKEIVDRIYAETVKALALPDIKEYWVQQGAEAGGQPPEQFGKYLNSEIAKWAKVVKDSGAKIDN